MSKTKDAYKTYAGIGARATPEHILDEMQDIAGELEEQGYILRTGGAAGADDAFMAGVSNTDNVELYLPWQGYNNFQSVNDRPTTGAYEIAWRYHGNWAACTPGVRKMHARNANIVLGKDLKSPVDFILCYTEGGKAQGGTGMAIRIAEGEALIPVFDLGLGADYIFNQLAEWFKANN